MPEALQSHPEPDSTYHHRDSTPHHLEPTPAQYLDSSEVITSSQAVESLKERKITKVFLDLARQAASEIYFEDDRAKALAHIAQASGEPADLEAARQAASQIYNVYEYQRALTLKHIAQASGDPADFEAARQTASRIENKFHRALTLTRIAQASGDPADFEEARQAASQLDNEYQRAKVLARIAQASGEPADFEEARQIASKINGIAGRAKALARIAQASGEPADFEEARQATSQIEDESDRADVLVGIAWDEASVGQFEEARQTASQIEVESDRSDVLAKIAQASGEPADFEEARQAASQLDDEYYRANDLTRIAQASGEPADFEAARQTASRVENEFHRALTLTHIAQASGELADFETARQAASQIEVESDRSDVLAKIAQASGEPADFEAARQAASQLDDEYRSRKALVKITQAEVKLAVRLERDWDNMSSEEKQKIIENTQQLTGTTEYSSRQVGEQDALKQYLTEAVRQARVPELVSLTELKLAEHDRELNLGTFLPLMEKMENTLVLVQHIDSIEQLAALLSTLDHESLPQLLNIDPQNTNRLTQAKAMICQNIISSLKLTEHDLRLKDRLYLHHSADEKSPTTLRQRQAAFGQLERLISHDTDRQLLQTLFEKGYGMKELFEYPWLATREIADFDGPPFPASGNRQHQARWLAHHCFSSLPGFNKTSIGQIILTRLNTGLESSVHDASQWLSSFAVPSEGYSIAEARQLAQREVDDLLDIDLQKKTLHSATTELELLRAAWRADETGRQDLPGHSKPNEINRYSSYFADQINTLLYQAILTVSPGASTEQIHQAINDLSDSYLEQLLSPQTKEMTTHIGDIEELRDKAFERLVTISQASQPDNEVKISGLLGQLKRMGEARKAYIDDATKWLSGNSDTPQQKLTKAWGDRPLAIAEGVRDTPNEILRWASTNALIMAARQMADSDGVIRRVSRKGKERTFDIRRLRTDYADTAQELSRCYGAETSIKAIMKYDRIHNPEADFPSTVIELESGYRFEILAKDDPRGFTIGEDTGCCMTLDGVSRDCIWAGYRDRRYGFAALYDKSGKLVAQSLIYHDAEQDESVMVLDNIEFSGSRDIRKIYDVYRSALGIYLDQQSEADTDFSIQQINVGTGYLDVSTSDLKKAKPVKSPDCNYTDAKNQMILLQRGNEG